MDVEMEMVLIFVMVYVQTLNVLVCFANRGLSVEHEERLVSLPEGSCQ
jgi:hypothetical protein